ncbi:MAG: peptidylprolyl isomerase [Leptospirales bacterium]
MKIENEKFVTIEYTLKNDEGNVIDTTEGKDPLPYVHGTGHLLAGLENALEGKVSGESVDVKLAPEQGYGAVLEDRIFDVPKSDMESIENLKEGMTLHAQTPNGVETFIILQIGDETIKVDGNHPLAGQNLHFAVTVSEVRDATEKELKPDHECGCGDNEHGEKHEKGGKCNEESCTC